MKKSIFPNPRGRPRKIDDSIDSRYELRIPSSVKHLDDIPSDPQELIAFKRRLTEELLLYYKSGHARSLIGKIYSAKQLRIKRLIWLSGGGARVSHACSISRSAMSRWIDRENVPPRYWPVFAKLLEGKISVGDIAKVMMGN